MLRNHVPAITSPVGGLVFGTAAVLLLFALAFAHETLVAVAYFGLLGVLPFSSRTSVGPEGTAFAGAAILALVAIPLIASPQATGAWLVIAAAGPAPAALLFILRRRQMALRSRSGWTSLERTEGPE